MKYPFYAGEGKRSNRDQPLTLPKSRRSELETPDKYLADPGLVDACNVALLLGQPILLTGEPGTGKTMFAYSLTWELGLDEPLKFETKSTSTSRDLFYTYDAILRFQEAQTNLKRSPLSYITYQALGLAILRTRDPEDISEYVPPGFSHIRKSRSVVLIDEIDKAPRDFPNDILNELELLYFRVPEMGNVTFEADLDFQPIVVITSNSERDLPDPFLRRCVFYNIPFPDHDRLSEIVTNRLGLYSAGSSQFIHDAIGIFSTLREPTSGLRKNPATAELLGWMMALRDIAEGQENPLSEPNLVFQTLGTLVKSAEDQYIAREIVHQWLDRRSN